MGVGGRTIAEAKQTISYPEFLQWCRYRNLRGSFNIGMRTDRAIARFSAMYASAHSKNKSFSISDFSPFDKPQVTSLEEAMKEWR